MKESSVSKPAWFIYVSQCKTTTQKNHIKKNEMIMKIKVKCLQGILFCQEKGMINAPPPNVYYKKVLSKMYSGFCKIS